VSVGVAEDLSEVEARRVRTINVIALVAAVATVLTTTVYIVSVDSDSAFITIGLSALFVSGYGATFAVNASGRVELAAWLVLTTGVVQIVLTTFVAGFTQGPAPFFLVIALGAVLITRVEDRATRWFFVGVAVVGYGVLAAIDPNGPASIAGTPTGRFTAARQFVLMILFATGVAMYQRLLSQRAEEALAEANARSEELLLNVLPEAIAAKLKEDAGTIADRYESISILFADIVGFTPMSLDLTPEETVDLLNQYFTYVDELVDRLGVEKIRTIGDNYMAAAGVPTPRPDHAAVLAEMAIAIRDYVKDAVPINGHRLDFRIGINSGPVVAGVIGTKKFQYDIWGDAVKPPAGWNLTVSPDASRSARRHGI
jgi:adenylate cyclase